MLRWALMFLVIALVAALFGFGGVAGTSMSAARILFFVFLVMFVISLCCLYLVHRTMQLISPATASPATGQKA